MGLVLKNIRVVEWMIRSVWWSVEDMFTGLKMTQFQSVQPEHIPNIC